MLNLQVVKGKNRNLERHRPHIKNIMKYLDAFAEDENVDENVEEILYYLLHNKLAKECKFTNAKQLLQIYRGVTLGQLTPEEGFANRIFANRSKEEHHELSRFLRQKTKMRIFPSKEEEEEVSNTLKPRSVSFKLYDKQDRNLQEVLMDYKAPMPPKKPVTKKERKSEWTDDNKNEDEILEGDAAEEANVRYKKKLEIYKKNLLPTFFQDEEIMIYPEDVQPNCIMVAEKYQHVLAAAIYELRDRIKSNTLIHNKNNPTKKIVPGIPHLTYVKCFDGCDGFGNLKLISEHCQRTLPDHGLGYDMSISEIRIKPCEEEPMTVPNFINVKNSQDKHDDDDSDYSDYDSEEDEEPINSLTNHPMRKDFIIENLYESDIFDDENSTVDSTVDRPKDYFLMYHEKKPEGSINTRPVYRGAADENDTLTTTLIAKTTEKQRLALTDDLRMVLDIGDNFLLNIDFSIQSSMVDMKYRRAMRGYKKGNPSFGCFLCTKPSKEWSNIDLILSGFKIDCHDEEQNNWQNIIT